MDKSSRCFTKRLLVDEDKWNRFIALVSKEKRIHSYGTQHGKNFVKFVEPATYAWVAEMYKKA
jgi:hypothetical protein